MNQRQILRSLELFRKGCNVQEVMARMRISYRQAQRLKQLYLQETEMAEKVMRSDPEITDYYRAELEKEPQNIWDSVELITDFLPEALEIFFLIPGADSPAVWASDDEIYKEGLIFRDLRFASRFN